MNLLIDGLLLMLIGMGTVFVFLGLMVLMILVISRCVAPFAHLISDTTTASPAARPPAATKAQKSAALIAVVSTAIHRFRQDFEQ